MIIGRSHSITGPYLDRDRSGPPVQRRNDLRGRSGPEIGPGQFAQYTLNGEERFSYHFYLTNGQSRHGGRRIEWGADEWPKAVFPPTVPRGIYRLRKQGTLRLAVRNESTNPATEAHMSRIRRQDGRARTGC